MLRKPNSVRTNALKAVVVYTEISPFKEKNLGKTAKGCTSCNANSNKRTASC